MMYVWLVLSAVLFSVGEYLSKRWALEPDIPGALLTLVPYCLGVLAWLPAIHIRKELAVVGSIYCSLTAVATVLMGVLVFQEHLTTQQWIGVVLAIVAVAFLS